MVLVEAADRVLPPYAHDLSERARVQLERLGVTVWLGRRVTGIDEHGVDCWLSLESPMACGFGACFSCVTRVKTPDGWDYRRVCVDGPVFDAASLEWDQAPC